jgi:2-hydroxychromene-2-carboxylate isomerase
MADPIRFWFDFSSPYSYVASSWIESLAARHGRGVRWHAILLGATFQAADLKSPVAYPLKREYSMRDFERSARFHGVPYRTPARFPIPTQNAARVFWWLHDRDPAHGPAEAARFARHGLQVYWVHGLDLSEPATLRAVCRDFGLDPDACEAVWNDPAWKGRLKAANDEAIASGVFGAPFFMIDDEPFWGQDRAPQMERWLAEGGF